MHASVLYTLLYDMRLCMHSARINRDGLTTNQVTYLFSHLSQNIRSLNISKANLGNKLGDAYLAHQEIFKDGRSYHRLH